MSDTPPAVSELVSEIEFAPDSTIAAIVKQLRDSGKPWAEIDVDVRNEMTSDWRKRIDHYVGLHIADRDAKLAGLKNDAASMQLQRDQALREFSQERELHQARKLCVTQLHEQLAAVTAERDAFTAKLTAVRAERPEVEKIREHVNRQFAKEMDLQSESNFDVCIGRLNTAVQSCRALLSALDASDKNEAAWRNAAVAWKAELTGRDEKIEGLTRALETSPSQQSLRELIDIAWNEATESDHVPSTDWADRMIDKWRAALAPPAQKENVSA